MALPVDCYPLNRTEVGYLALHGMAGSVNQPYLLRLNRPLDADAVRAALRRLVSAHPRLRTLVEPGWHQHHFRVLPDDEIVDQLFEVAFRVRNDVDLDDPLALEMHHNELLNTPLPLERGLGLHSAFYPHPSRPLVMINVHHMLQDGRSMLRVVGDLLALLNGRAIQPTTMDCPSLLPPIAPQGLANWPRKLWAARAHAQAEAARRQSTPPVQLPTRHTPNYSAHVVQHHRLSASASALRRRARALGVSLNTLLVALFAEAFLRLEGQDPASAAVIRLSVDLRRYYPEGHQPEMGNFVAAFLVWEAVRGRPFEQRVRSVEDQVRQAMQRFDAREMCWGYLFEEAVRWLGRTAFGKLAWNLKRRGRFPQISLHATSLGDTNRLNAPDASVRIEQVWAVTCSLSLLVVITELADTIFLPVSFQRCETPPQAVREFMRHVDEVATEVASAHQVSSPGAPPAPTP